MIEVEVKAKVDDLNKFKAALKAMGAQFIKKVEDVDLYFNAPHRDFMETDEAFRVRRRDDEIIVTYKGPK
ncbi:MAG: class IV adenylate cyclase, partial [Asgard group archaeon]